MKNDRDHGNIVPKPTKVAGLSLDFNEPLALVGGSPIDATTFDLVRERTNFFVAADGGADALLANGLIPHAVIGDMDSLSDAARAVIPARHLHRIEEQDSTDFDKTLRSVTAPLILAVGFSGARLDHELAALNVLVRYPDRAVILIGAEDITLHVPAKMVLLRLAPGTRLSLFPMDGVRVRAQGLKWSFDALDLHPARKIGTSNAVRDPDVRLATDRPGLLLILPREALGAAITALAGADFHSPPD